jgi:hypothetical protein
MLHRCFPPSVVARLLIPSRSFSSSIKIFDERADENFFFSKQDEALLKKIFDAEATKSAEAAAFGGASLESLAEGATTEDKVKLVFMKHGIPPSANPALLRDLVDLLNKHK